MVGLVAIQCSQFCNHYAQVQALSLKQLEALGEALLDFTQLDDLMHWLEHNT